MHLTTFGSRHWAILLGIAAYALSSLAAAEPPSRAARLSYINGTVSFSPAGQPDWVQAMINRPLTTGDALWAEENSRAELQVGGAAIRMGSLTSVTLTNLDDHIAQVQLSQGTLRVRVRRMGQGQIFEVDTPNLAFTLRRAGEYRIDVDPNGDATAVRVLSGEAEVYGEGASYALNSRQGYRFFGTDLTSYELLAPPREDDLDRWARARDKRGDNSPSARYVSSDVIGYEDLDSNGTWHTDPEYGNVWMPTHVSANWTPYSDGHWAWVDPWGWSWVDDATWGFAVSHYGRWARIQGAWGWVPGPVREQAVYAPALVAFVGGKNFQGSVAVGSMIAAVVGWFPLAPREVYRPSYPVSRGYFDHINRSNAVIAPATIATVYNTTNVSNTTTTVNNTNISVTNVVYANQQVNGAVVAVPAQVFVQSQPVAKAIVAVPKEVAVSTLAGNVAAVAPVPQSVHGGAPSAGTKPPANEHPVVARAAPPPPPVAFAIQQEQLAAKPGTPIGETQRKQLKPLAVATPTISVVTTAHAPTPNALPPEAPPATKSPNARKIDAAKNDLLKADPAIPDTVKLETAKPVPKNGEAAPTGATKFETVTPATGKADASPNNAAKTEASNADILKAGASHAASDKTIASQADAAKAEAAKTETLRTEAAKAVAAKAVASQADAVKAEAAKTETLRTEAAKAVAAKAAASQADAAKLEAAKLAAAKAAASEVDANKAEAAKGAKAKADALLKAEEEKKKAAEEAQKRKSEGG